MTDSIPNAGNLGTTAYERLHAEIARAEDIIKRGDFATKTDIATQAARIDSFTKLGEGSTTGDAELIDGRTGADGITYTNIGGAIRGQIKQITDEFFPINLLNKNKITYGKFAKVENENEEVIVDNSDINYITINTKEGDIIRTNLPVWIYSKGILGDNDKYCTKYLSGQTTYTVLDDTSVGIKNICVVISFDKKLTDDLMITKNMSIPNEYIPYGLNIPNLILTENQRGQFGTEKNIIHLLKNNYSIMSNGYSIADLKNTEYLSSDICKVDAGTIIRYKLVAPSTLANIVIFDKNLKVTRVFAGSTMQFDFNENEIIINDNEKYIRFSKLTREGEYLKIINGNVTELETNVFNRGNNYNLSRSFKNVLFIGDSFTSDGIQDRKYPYYFKESTGCEATCLGIAGGDATNVYSEKVKTFDFTDNTFDACFILLGYNGGLTDTVSTDTAFDNYENYADTRTGRYCSIIEHIKDKCPGIHIFLLTLPPRTSITYENDGLCSLVLHKIAEKYDIAILDEYLDGNFNILTVENCTVDTIHRNTLGMRILADDVIRLMCDEIVRNPYRYKDIV